MRKSSIPFYVVSALAALILLAGCQTVTTGHGTTAPSSATPTAPAADAVHYTVDEAHSEVVFLVYKAGALASFGHNHVVEAHDLRGDVYLAPNFKASSLSLSLPVKSFEVDRPDARNAEGADFASHPSAQAIQGTTEHMLGADCLDAQHSHSTSVTGRRRAPKQKRNSPAHHPARHGARSEVAS